MVNTISNVPITTSIVVNFCFEMTKSVILAKKSLDIIFTGPSCKKSTPELPCWIPDFVHFGRGGDRHLFAHLSAYISGDDCRLRCGHMGYRWNATGRSGIRPTSTQFIDDRRIRIRGYRFAKIKTLGAILTDEGPSTLQHPVSRPSDKAMEDLRKAVAAALSLYDSEYLNSTSDPRMNWFLWNFGNSRLYAAKPMRTICEKYQLIRKWREYNAECIVGGTTLKWTQGRSNPSRKRKKDIAVEIVGSAVSTVAGQILAEMMGSVLKLPSTSPPYRAPPPKMNYDMPPGDLVAALENLQRLIKEGLRLISTHDNRVGWAHPAAKAGDRLCLIEGCSMPAILRESQRDPGTFELVGHAYVHGVMNNELWSQLRIDQFESITLS